MDQISLPGCDTPTAPLGVGTWAWGDKATWGMGGYDADLSEATIAEAWEASAEAGVTLFDTAEVYGGGESERIIGKLLARDPARRPSVLLATKFMPMPYKLNVKGALRSSLLRSIERLGVDHVDLYQLHGPISLRSMGALADALAAVRAEGLTRAVGVSNYSARETERIHATLAKRGVPLASNQVEFSLLRRRPETSGLFATCRRLGVVLLAYSPMGMGRLTGKYSTANPPKGRRNFSAQPMADVDRVVDVLRRIGAAHDRSPSQVALRWLIEKGAVPIPGAKNGEQARQNAGALGWQLPAEEMTELDAVSMDPKPSLQNRI